MSGQPGAGTRRRVKVVILVLAGLLVIAAGAAAVYTLSLARSFDEGRTVVEEAFPDEEIRPAPPAPESKAHRAQNILPLGPDTRGAIGDDTDAITAPRAEATRTVHLPADPATAHVRP